MESTPLVLGIDLGTSGVRIAVLEQGGRLRHEASTPYRHGLTNPNDWCDACQELIQDIPTPLNQRLVAVAVDGTSGTLLACDQQGVPLSRALAYFESFPEQSERIARLAPAGGPAASSSGSLARALHLIDQHGESLLLRHQADWINGWLLNDWHWGEEGNNLRLGWDLETEHWLPSFSMESWSAALPQVQPSGTALGRIAKQQAETLGVPGDLQVVAGTTDSNAAVLAADPGHDDGITVLGTTLVIKRFTTQPIHGVGITRHRVGGRWLCGGASNTGGGILRRFFNDDQLEELSRQIDPESDSGLTFMPLPQPGERFPVDDPLLQPILEPRPVSDSLYLHGLLEGIADIEAQGWKRLNELGAPTPQRVISIGGGARNPQWRRLRERRLGCPVVSCRATPAAGVARLALAAQA